MLLIHYRFSLFIILVCRFYKVGNGCYPNAAVAINSYLMDYCYSGNYDSNGATVYLSFNVDSEAMFEYDYYGSAVCSDVAATSVSGFRVTTDCQDNVDQVSISYDYRRYYNNVLHTSKMRHIIWCFLFISNYLFVLYRWH